MLRLRGRAASDAARSEAAYSAGPLSLTSEEEDEDEDLLREDERGARLALAKDSPLSPRSSRTSRTSESSGTSSASGASGASSRSDARSTDSDSASSASSSASQASSGRIARSDKAQHPSEALASEVCKTLREQAHNGDDVMRLIKVRFESLDKDRKGFINAEEFRQLLVAVLGGRAVASEDAARLLKRLHADTDHNGQVSYDEFVSFVSLDRATIAATARRLRAALLARLRNEEKGSTADLFGRFCDAKQNVIGPQDFKVLVQQLKVGAEVMTAGERDGLMGFIDRQGKGHIDISDFQLFLEHPHDAGAEEDRRARRGKRRPLAHEEEAKSDSSEVDAATQAHGPRSAAEIDGTTADDGDDAVVVDVQLAIHGTSKRRRDQLDALLAQGYTRLVSNLNDGGRGYRLHLYVRRANAEAFGSKEAYKRARVTDIALSRSSKDPGMLALGYQCVEPYSTSQGAWFVRRQYLWVRRNAEDPHPILDVAVTAGRKRDLASKLWTPPCRGYKRIDGDLNAGNRGSQVFLWFLKESFRDDDGPYAQLARLVRGKLRRVAADEAIDVEALWERYDKRDKGWLSREKFRRLLARDLGLGLSKADVDKVAKVLDVNEDGRIDRDEFVEFLAFNPAHIHRILREIASALRKRDMDSRASVRRWLAATEGPLSRSKAVGPRGANAANASPKDIGRALKRVGVRLSADDFTALMGRFDKHGVGLVDTRDFADAVSRRIRALKERAAADPETGGMGSPSDPAAKAFVNVEVAARKLRSFARNLAGPDLDMSKACDALLGGRDKDRLSRDRVREVLDKEFKLALTDKEIAMLLLRTGATRTKLIDFCTSSTYLDAVLNRVVDAALKVETRRFFRQLDAEGNGRLSRANFASGLKSLELDGQRIQLSAKEVNQIVQRFDQDGDGAVDLDEFLHFIQSADHARRAARDALLDEEERKLDDARVLYVFSALRKLHLVDHHTVDLLFAKFFEGGDPDGEAGFSLDGLERGLSRLGLVPQEVQLSAAQFQQVFRRMDLGATGVVRRRHFARFLARGIPGASPGAGAGSAPKVRIPPRLRGVLVAEARALQDAMHALDARGTGMVANAGFVSALRRLGVASRDARIVAKAFDAASKSGDDVVVDYEALLTWVDQERMRKRRGSDDDDDADGYASPLHRRGRSRARRHRRRGRRVLSDDENDGVGDAASYFGSDEDDFEADLPGPVRALLREFPSRTRLATALREYCEADGGGLTRGSVNELLEDSGIDGLSRREWDALDVRSVKELCALAHGGRARRERRSSPSPSRAQNFGASADEDDADEETAAEMALARDYVSRCVREAVHRGDFAWEPAARLFDHDGSGTIRVKDMARVLRACGCRLSLAKVRGVGHALAALRDHGQRVNYEHFFARVLDERGSHGASTTQDRRAGRVSFEAVEAKIRNAIRAEGFADGRDLDEELARLDHDGDGKVTVTVLARALPRLLGGLELLPGELQAVIDHFDHDGSGKVDVGEVAGLVELKDVDVDELVVRVKEELREQARMGTRLEDSFAQADANGDGQLSRREFRKSLDQLLPPGRRLSNREVRKLMDRFDPGRNGRVDYAAFCELCAPSEIEMLALEAKVREKVRGVASQARGGRVDLRKAFALFDAGGHGRVSRRDFQQACDRLGLALSEDELELLLQRFDTNGSGAVDYFEFSRFIEYDGTEIEDLVVRAGRHLDCLQCDGVDPVRSFEILEGRRLAVGVLPRHAFYRGCRDLRMPFGDAEISALADLYADAGSVRYRDFCLSTLSRAGARYQGQLASGPGVGDVHQREHRDEVWNPENVRAWLDTQATVDQKRKMKHLQKAISRAYEGSYGTDDENVEVAANHVRISRGAMLAAGAGAADPSALYGQAPRERWDCPVCFYKQSRVNRLTCEMCDSPCPTREATKGGQWPYVKPIFDQAYKPVGTTPAGVSILNPLPALDLAPRPQQDPKRAPKWHIIAEVDSPPRERSLSPRRSPRQEAGSARSARSESSPRQDARSRSRSPRTPTSGSPRSSRYY